MLAMDSDAPVVNPEDNADPLMEDVVPHEESHGAEESTSSPTTLQTENDPIVALSTAVAALVESNRVMQASLTQLGKRQQKIYELTPQREIRRA